MITIFNRKEVLTTMDMKRQASVRDVLSANGIDYIVKVSDRQTSDIFASSRTRCGSFGVDQNSAYEYKIYVHKKDYDNAMRLMR